MSLTTTPDSSATGQSSDPALPPDLDPETHRIIATHFFGIELRDVRETWWELARQGYPPVPEKDVILIEGGRRG